MKSFRDVFGFFFALGRRARKTKVFYLLSFLPVIMSFVIKFYQIFSGHERFEGIYIFNNIINTTTSTDIHNTHTQCMTSSRGTLWCP